ncbi:MAG: hypothetical protein FGM33_08655 [Candidatus Kapabacteria bacterium]|nr:hypothetical protein [Candidatus Kapabacteria bacterium]
MMLMRPYRMMHALATMALLLIGLGADLYAQPGEIKVPMRLSFQGLLLRKDGTLFQDGTWNVTAELYDAETGGNRVYTTTMPVVVVRGVFNMIIGENDPLDGVDFKKQLWLDIQAPDALPFSKRTQLTTAPYAFMAQSAVVAGGLSPDATGAVLSLNGLQGNVNLKAGAGVTIVEDANSNEVIIDATNLLEMIDLVPTDQAVIDIRRRKVIDPNTGEEKTVIEVGLKDSSLTRKYLSTSDAKFQNFNVGFTRDSILIPQYVIDRDGRIVSVTQARVPRVPDNFLPNRVMLTGGDGKLVESGELGDRQMVMGRTGGTPRVTTVAGIDGIKVEQRSDSLVVSTDIGKLLPIASGRYTNTGSTYVYETPDFDIRTAQPVSFAELKETARIMVTMESENSTTAFTVTNRTRFGFRVKFAGGLPPNASISWMVLNL